MKKVFELMLSVACVVGSLILGLILTIMKIVGILLGIIADSFNNKFLKTQVLLMKRDCAKVFHWWLYDVILHKMSKDDSELKDTMDETWFTLYHAFDGKLDVVVNDFETQIENLG